MKKKESDEIKYENTPGENPYKLERDLNKINPELSQIRTVAAKYRRMIRLEELTDKEINVLKRFGTLCWSCECAMMVRCSWMQGFRPVKGWVATPVLTELGLRSYHVYDCPLFEPCHPRRKLSDLRN